MPESLSSLGVETMNAVFGGKWRPLILLHLIPRKRHFGELLRLIPDISKKVLTEQLRELEREGIITRTVLGKVPAKVEYALSAYGSSTIPILDSMCKWGHRHAKFLPQKRKKITGQSSTHSNADTSRPEISEAKHHPKYLLVETKRSY
jgi:DNA-binding HxlR family transcriptional regulator